MKKSTVILIIKSCSLAAYIILIIGLERVYRNPLFLKSLTVEKEWQTNASHITMSFFKVITNFGTQIVFIPLLFLIFFFFPLTKSYTFLSVIIVSLYFYSMLKIIYGDPRPFWIDSTLTKGCDGGFGNPSGHSCASTSVYLSFWHLITDFRFFVEKVAGKIVRILLLFFFLALIVAIVLSRLYLGVHSIDQVIYGVTLGFAFYFLYFHVFSFQKYSGKDLFDMFTNKNYIIIYAVIYGCLFVLSLLLWGLVHHPIEQWINSLLKSDCNRLLHGYRRFNLDGLYGMLTIFGLIGAHYGIYFMVKMTKNKYPNKEEEIINWNKGGGFLNYLYRILLGLAFISPISLYFAIPSDTSMPVVFIFKLILPYIISLFNLYGLCLYCSILLKIANPSIYSDGIRPAIDLERGYKVTQNYETSI